MTVSQFCRFTLKTAVLSALILSGCQSKEDSASALVAGDDAGVFGGQPVERKHSIFNYVVGIRYPDKEGNHKVCTGALIAPQLVLTAAHCVQAETSQIRVYFITDMDRTDSARSDDVRRVERIVIPDGFEEARKDSSKPNRFDIALVKLRSSAPDHTLHFFVAEEQYSISRVPQVQVVGYGAEAFLYSDRSTQGDSKLKAAVVDRQESRHDGVLQLNQTKSSGICVGDSGGPAFVPNQGGGHLLVGIATSVINPGGSDACRGWSNYVSVAAWYPWITRNSLKLMQKLK